LANAKGAKAKRMAMTKIRILPPFLFYMSCKSMPVSPSTARHARKNETAKAPAPASRR
jgi:hypothetical protein